MATKRKNKKISKTILSIALMIIAIVGLFGYVLPVYNKAKNIGIGIGDTTGKMVGDVIGSFNGISSGISEGTLDGKKEGLSAKDTRADLKKSIKEVGRLEILEAGITIENLNQIGDDYIGLYVLKGVAEFSIDLNEIDIEEVGEDTMQILLPEIEVDVYVDERETEKLAEYQKHVWSGSTEDGLKAYMNSREVGNASIKDSIENSDSLLMEAENSAKEQVKILASSATGNNKDIIVVFKKEVQGNE